MLLARQAIDNLNDDKREIENDMRCAAQEIDGGTTFLGVGPKVTPPGRPGGKSND